MGANKPDAWKIAALIPVGLFLAWLINGRDAGADGFLPLAGLLMAGLLVGLAILSRLRRKG